MFKISGHSSTITNLRARIPPTTIVAIVVVRVTRTDVTIDIAQMPRAMTVAAIPITDAAQVIGSGDARDEVGDARDETASATIRVTFALIVSTVLVRPNAILDFARGPAIAPALRVVKSGEMTMQQINRNNRNKTVGVAPEEDVAETHPRPIPRADQHPSKATAAKVVALKV